MVTIQYQYSGSIESIRVDYATAQELTKALKEKGVEVQVI